MVEAGRVAKGLTEAQRVDIAAADVDDPRCGYCSRLYNDELTFPLLDAYPAHHDPDCTPEDDGGTRWSWTPLGLAVRAHLAGDGE